MEVYGSAVFIMTEGNESSSQGTALKWWRPHQANVWSRSNHKWTTFDLVSDDPRDPEALTPNHLLLLCWGPTLAPGVFSKDDCYSRCRWRHTYYMTDVFWRRWTPSHVLRETKVEPRKQEFYSWQCCSFARWESTAKLLASRAYPRSVSQPEWWHTTECKSEDEDICSCASYWQDCAVRGCLNMTLENFACILTFSLCLVHNYWLNFSNLVVCI